MYNVANNRLKNRTPTPKLHMRQIEHLKDRGYDIQNVKYKNTEYCIVTEQWIITTFANLE